jgi:tellurium resistance protein TerD
MTGIEPPQGEIRACFKRCGHKKPFLGCSGWQVAEDWVKVEKGKSDIGVTNLIFSPEVTTWLEEGSNYVLSLNVEGDRIFERPIRWGNIASLSSRIPASSPKLVDQEQCDSTKASKNSQDDENAWIVAKNLDTKQGYKIYLDSFPLGIFSRNAGEALKKFMPPQVIVRVVSNFCDNCLSSRFETCAFLLSSDRRVRGDSDFVDSFATDGDSGVVLSESPCGSVCHLGRIVDSQNGSVTESIIIDFSKLPLTVNSIAITVSVWEKTRMVGLESVVNGALEILEGRSKVSIDEIYMQTPSLGFKGSFLVEFMRWGDDWILLKKNEMFVGGLNEICKYFGLEVC